MHTMRNSMALAAGVALALAMTTARADDQQALLEALKAQLAELQAQVEAIERSRAEEQARLAEDGARQAAEQARLAEAAKTAADRARAVQVYGQARISVDARSGDWADGQDGTQLNSNSSRFGIRGQLPTSIEGITMFYMLEAFYDSAGATGDDDVGLREGFAGLRGDWGAVRAGRLTVPYKGHYVRVDPWIDNVPQARGGGRQGVSELHSAYMNNAIEYRSMKLADAVTANAWYSTRFDDSNSKFNDAGALVNFRGGQAYGAGVNYDSGPLFLAADWLKIDADSIVSPVVEDGNAWQVLGQYRIGSDWSLALVYEDADELLLGKNLYGNLIYTLGKYQFIGAYGRNRDRVPNGERDWNNFSLGLKYALTRDSELFGAWNRLSDDTADEDFDTVTVGINAKFGY
jgi:hypothetical protein